MPSLGINHQRQRARILSRASHRFVCVVVLLLFLFLLFFPRYLRIRLHESLMEVLELVNPSGIFSSSGRIVVRRWYVPSFWPKPVPGTVEM